MGVAQKSTLSTVYSGVDLGVSSTTGKSIREHVLETPTDTEGSHYVCLLYTSPSPRDKRQSRMPSSA